MRELVASWPTLQKILTKIFQTEKLETQILKKGTKYNRYNKYINKYKEFLLFFNFPKKMPIKAKITNSEDEMDYLR